MKKVTKNIINHIGNYINKSDIIAIIVIVVFASIIAVVFNFLRSDKCSGSIPFFKPNIEDRLVNDNELFGDIIKEQNDEIKDNNENPVITQDTTIIDTIQITTIDSAEIKTTDAEKIDYETLSKEAKKSDADNFGAISLSQMKRIAEDTSGNFVIIDARQSEDYNKSHIGNAINIYPYDNEADVIEKIMALPKSKTIIVYCDGGDCDSSHQIGEMLKTFGYRFFLFEGGWEEWIKK